MKFIYIKCFVFICWLGGCAQPMGLTGGAQDTLPPTLLQSVPRHGTRNFKGQALHFTFNEWIQLKNQQTHLIINPEPKNNAFKTRIRRNKLSILFENPLQDSLSLIHI